MSKNERNEALWRLAVEIEAKKNAPASQRDCSAIQELRKRFDGLMRLREAKAVSVPDLAETPIMNERL